MKQFLILAFALAAVTACNEKKEQALIDTDKAERDSLIQIINQKDEEMNDIMSTFNDIQDGFREINEAENRLNLDKANPEKSSSQDILENIQFIKRTMSLNRQRIAKLKEQLRTSSIGVDKLQKAIANMQAELDQKSTQIAQLQQELEARDIHIAEQDKQINHLSSNVQNLAAENEEKARELATQDKQLHTAWYVFGTKKELKQQNILRSNDVLKSGSLNRDYFTQIDIRVDKIIKLYSKSAKLLTSHPAGSYTLEKDARGQYTLRITNPQQFWSVSRYLVVVVK